MTNNALAIVIRKKVPSISKALAALVEMERQLGAVKTYAQIEHIIRESKAVKELYGHVAKVKAQAEDTILIANRRIGEEVAKVPKATGGDRKSKLPRAVNSKSGRNATGIPGTSRARLKRLVAIPVADLKAVATELRAAGKDATVHAVVREITQGDKKQRRADREKQLGLKQRALPDRKYGVIVADPEWDDEVWSRETGMDRHAGNHYPTSDAKAIAARPVAKIAAADTVLFLWTTNQHLRIAIGVLEAWGFQYKSNYVWGKDKISTGRWNRSKHEILLVATRGKPPCPAPGTQWDSLIMAAKGEHSAKPECFLEMIEAYYPNLPKIELNRRGPARSGWDAWGNEADNAEAAE
jgi:N6-adenosine-specific RNA methylase IME4